MLVLVNCSELVHELIIKILRGLADLFESVQGFRVLENTLIFRNVLGLLLIHETTNWSRLIAHYLRSSSLVCGHTFKARSSEEMSFLADLFHRWLILGVVHTNMAQF